ncbi:MAG: 1-acyl-sn-glycerol-3-phosphate acyltransferase [Acidobacteria bacterium]|nr:1-acyl-sn-glycerol-3-phosphate acyltransferase [Acidobacteriota bacterium]
MSNWRRNPVWGLATILLMGLNVALACLTIPLTSIVLGRQRAFLGIARLWCRVAWAVGGIRFRILGWDELPEDIRSGRQPVVFMSNHQSHLDPPFLIAELGVYTVFIAKRELKWVPLLGQLIWFMGFIFINRQNRSKAIESLKDAARRIQQGQSVVIFPEGTRTQDGRIQEFKKGGFALAQDAGVPIVPIGISGGFERLPKGSRRILPGDYTVRIGLPVATVGASREAVMATVRERITALAEGR